jgi:hypothetical protein
VACQTIALSGDATVLEIREYTLTRETVIDLGKDTVTEDIVHWENSRLNTYTSADAIAHTYASGLSSCLFQERNCLVISPLFDAGV